MPVESQLNVLLTVLVQSSLGAGVSPGSWVPGTPQLAGGKLCVHSVQNKRWNGTTIERRLVSCNRRAVLEEPHVFTIFQSHMRRLPSLINHPAAALLFIMLFSPQNLNSSQFFLPEFSLALEGLLLEPF